jgi:hypothetical protein
VSMQFVKILPCTHLFDAATMLLLCCRLKKLKQYNRIKFSFLEALT